MPQYLRLLPLLFALHTGTAHAQEATKKDNYTVQFLLVYNEHHQLLMMHNAMGWHMPAVRSNDSLDIREALHQLAGTLGLTLENIRLAGLYTHKFEGLPDHKELSFRTYYTAKLKSGTLKQPPASNIYYEWMAPQEGLPKLHFEFMRQQLTPIVTQPGKVWGGTYLIVWKDDNYVGSKELEAPYLLAD
ncbi:hypothetical protein SAMN05444266_109260 [Chitinophaga jiangningensis]|uniref:NUDIX domain-containing protein n=1 Tax=Chitinophaga jiangningensis TaxID=1419482 RepID=A0A1M7KD65_9BACT|nr:NUDIX hydrolase [Chitinophaga jiangningensis]SHM63209.1 hypothetical protein SAMN05444266_109260 [Chitinophaga jiangningensis]